MWYAGDEDNPDDVTSGEVDDPELDDDFDDEYEDDDDDEDSSLIEDEPTADSSVDDE